MCLRQTVSPVCKWPKFVRCPEFLWIKWTRPGLIVLNHAKNVSLLGGPFEVNYDNKPIDRSTWSCFPFTNISPIPRRSSWYFHSTRFINPTTEFYLFYLRLAGGPTLTYQNKNLIYLPGFGDWMSAEISTPFDTCRKQDAHFNILRDNGPTKANTFYSV